MDVKIFSLFSSSTGNSLYIKCGSDEILIDAGMSAKSIETSLNDLNSSLERIKAIFITHEHSDHIKGLKTISKKYAIPIYIPSLCAKTLPAECSPHVVPNDPGDVWESDGIRIETHEVPHDSVQCVCFRMELGTKTFGYATDIGHLSHEVQDTVFGCDTVFIESNHDLSMLKNGPYPYVIKQRILGKFGHLSNEECSRFLPYLVRGGTENIVLAHLSTQNNLPEIAFKVARDKLGDNGFSVAGDAFGADVSLCVASPSKTVRVNI